MAHVQHGPKRSVKRFKMDFARSYEGTESLRPAKDRRIFYELLSLYYSLNLPKELHVTNTAQKLYISQQNLKPAYPASGTVLRCPSLPQKAKARPYLCRGAALRCRRKILAEEHEFQNRLADISEKSIGNLKLGIPSYRGQICLPEILRDSTRNGRISRSSSAMNPPTQWKNVSTMGNLIFLSVSCIRIIPNWNLPLF